VDAPIDRDDVVVIIESLLDTRWRLDCVLAILQEDEDEEET
jgi:hypothetical protein